MKVHDYEKLTVWQKSMDLVVIVYRITRIFPKDELYGLTSQIRRASVSIPSNIAEGSHRQTRPDFRQFLVIAMGSASELETQIKISRRLHYISEKEYDEVNSLLGEILRMLNKFIATLS